jgi:hypothetical protein
MTTKYEVIQQAYQEIRISGITVIPRPSDEALALVRLENMMAEFFGNLNFDVHYNFENVPNLNSVTNVTRNFVSMMAYNLAVRLIPAFNKQVPPILYDLASTAFSSSLGAVKLLQLRQVQPSRSMPRGSGNTNQNLGWNRFSIPLELPPTMPGNQEIFVGEIQDYSENYSAWLGLNTIASFTLEVDPRLTIIASAISVSDITYTLSAPSGSGPATGPWQLVKITVTDSAGRVDIRLINFEVTTPPEVS